MAYSITTKDGITIDNIPDEVAPDDASLKQRVADIRAGKTPATTERPLTEGEQVPEGYETFHDPMQGTMIRPIAEERTIGEKVVGAGEAALSMGTAATGGTIGHITGVLTGLLDSISSGQYGTEEGAKLVEKTASDLAQSLTYAPRTEAGQEYTQEVAETLAPLEALAPMAGEIGTVTRAIKPVAQKVAAPVTKAIAEEVDLFKSAIPETQKVKQLKTTIKENPTDKNVALYKIEKDTAGERVVKDTTAQEALKQGFEDRVIASVKASSPEDRTKMRKMLNVHKLGKKSATFAAKNRPADILGQSMDDRIKFLAREKKQAGQDLNLIAGNLKGKTVDYKQSVDNLTQSLEDIGVGIQVGEKGTIKAILKGSDIEGDNQSKKLLSNILGRAVTGELDAKGLHNLKRFIDTQVSYGKRSANPISGTTERIMKDFRRSINDDIGKQFPEYKNTNTKYSETLQALKEIQDAAGTKLDLDSPNVDKALGTSARKLLSNYGSRVQMMDAIEKANSTAKKYGLKTNDDILNQVIFVNEIDRMFGAPAATSFKGQIEQAVAKGTDIARGGKVDIAIDMAKKGLEKAKGINEENAIKAIEQILKQKEEK